MNQLEKIKIIDRATAVEAIKQLGEEDLRYLNRLIVDRMRLLAQARATGEMARFVQGDRVVFQANDGRMVEGRVVRLNKKTISIMTDDGDQWNVSPSLLHLIHTAGEGVDSF